MAKQIFKLKRLLLDYASRCIALFTIVLYLFSQVANAQPPTTNFSSKLEKLSVSSQDQILTDYQEIIKIAQSKNDLRTEVDALYNVSNIYKNLGEYSKAIDFYNQTIKLVRFNKEDSERLNSGTQQCETFTRESETINYCPQIEPIEKYLIEINILLNLSDTYRVLGEYQQALTLNHQGLSLIKTIEVQSKDNSNQGNLVLLKAITTLYKSLIYFDLGEKEIAQDCVNEAQNIMNNLLKEFWEEENSESEEDYVSQKVSSLFSTSSLFSRFLTLIVNPDDKQLLTSLVDQWWQILQTIEKPQFDDSPAQFQQIENVFFEMIFNLNLYIIGNNYNQLGEKQKALEIYHKVLKTLKSLKISEIEPELEEQVKDINEIKEMLNIFTSQIKILVLKDMGEIFAEFGKKQEALDAYKQALKLLKITGERSTQAFIFDAMGKVYHSLEKYKLALDSYNQALKIWAELGNQLAEANTRLEIAIVERDRNHLDRAKTQIETAIELIEREPPPRDTDFSQASGDEQRKFQYYISLASYFSAKQHYYEFYVDLLMRLHEQFPSDGYMVQAFQANEQSKNRSLLAILNRRDRYVSNARIPSSSDIRYTELARVPRLSTIQQQVLDDESVLLEYALGEEHSYLWVVSKTEIYSYELPKRAEIEATARKFYDFMTVPSLRIRTNKAGKAGKELSQMLLGQVASQLGNKRLLIVGDGILQYIPFAALPGFNSDSTEPLLVSHEIVTLPSASTFAVLRNDSKNSPSPTQTLAILADPVFGHEDERLRGMPTQPSSQLKQRPLVGDHQPSASQFAEQLFPRLPSTRNEADQIASLVPPANQIQKFGFAASRQAVLDLELSQYSMIHFATHGILDAEKPERSGMLLSVVNEQDELQRSLLSTPDVFNLQLSADLVVLSGCRTGLGKQIKGEGLIGLTGGLMYAGAERVVVSLWSVDDQATAAFMSQFYQGVLKQNLPPAKALREAQLAILKQPRWQNPYYWAAFTLQGEWQ
ncbi:CHAT domain-containing protein [Coleofasciculus sp.]|uniref:CHAT domain-containing protein n=1 Tax=Coleofasciculus sp. TaxID=3100458 RepID=UPI0039FAD2F3